MAKKYTYDEIMEMSDKEFKKLQERHYFADSLSNPRVIHVDDSKIFTPYMKRELVRKGFTGLVVLGSVGLICLTAYKIADMMFDE